MKVPFAIADSGTPTLIRWGMDTAWDDEGNVLRGVNFIGRDRLTYGRVSFQVMDALNEDGTLSTRQLNYLKNRLRHISLTHPDGILLNSDPVDINTEVYTHHPEAWYKVIKATLKYVQDYGLKVVSGLHRSLQRAGRDSQQPGNKGRLQSRGQADKGRPVL